MAISLRLADPSDLNIIDDIYNEAIAHRYQTADSHPLTAHQRLQWYANHDRVRYPVYLIEMDGYAIGWSSLSKYREGREALRNTAEVSYYLSAVFQGKGHGSVILKETISRARDIGYQNLVAILLSSNEKSIRLLEKYGFTEWGRIPSAAEIDGQLFDHLYYGLALR